jgi:hypothetical protein
VKHENSECVKKKRNGRKKERIEIADDLVHGTLNVVLVKDPEIEMIEIEDMTDVKNLSIQNLSISIS